MEDLFKNFLYTGVGLVAMTAEKIQKSVGKLVSEGKLSLEEGKKVVDKLVNEGKLSTDEGKKVVDDLVKKGKLSAEEGKKMVDNFIKNAKTKKDEVESQLKSVVERLVSSFDFATTNEVNALKKRVATLEAKLKVSGKPVTKAPVKTSKKPAASKQKAVETV
ncbi:MAG: phasin family protein [Cyclobacteriaceae bacterium]|nr:phasin family protein [Cyclobacteriaceae bacterium]